MTREGRVRPRVLRIDGPADAAAAAAAPGPALVVSAPGAGRVAGPAWFHQVARPALGPRRRAVLDCGAWAGAALAALRHGGLDVRFTGAPDVRRRLAGMAHATGALVYDGDGLPLPEIPAARAPATTTETPMPCRLYLLTPPEIPDPAAFAETLAATLDAGDVACVQLRLKGVDDAALRRARDVLRPVCQDRDVAFVLNDRPDLAAEGGCDGVHVGRDDMPVKKARGIVGDGAIVGATCHDSRHLAMKAAEAGADYVAFGAFYPTDTKAPKTAADPEILEWWSSLMVVPCVAIGGITPDNAAPLVAAGADFLAVSGGVWNPPDGPAAAVRAFRDVLAGGA